MARLRVLIPLATAIGLLTFGAPAFLFLHVLLHVLPTDALTARIDARLNELGAKPAVTELISQRALRVRHAILDGDFSTANRLTSDVFGRSRLQEWRFYPWEDFIAGIFGALPPDFGRRLDEWVANDKGNAVPLMLRAQYYYDVGWAKRGDNFSNKTAPDRMTAFAADMKKALADIGAAIHLDQSNPYGFYLRLRILQGRGWSPAFGTAFSAGIAKYPTYYPLYEIVLSTLQPRWGGTLPAMYAFVDKYAGGAPQYSPLKLLYLSFYRHLLDTASVDCRSSGGDRDKTRQCIVAFMQRAVRPGLEQNVLAALGLYGHADKHQYGLIVKKIVSAMLATPGGDAYSGAVLQLAATAMRSDTQLKEEHPGHNDYIIDELVAESWQHKGFYDNEIAKYKEALADAEKAKFPSAAEKDAEIALIWEKLAEATAQQNRYIDEIAFEKAAVLLGLTWDEHYICQGYYELKHYDQAIQACTDAIKSTGNSYAWYWRGEAYDHAGQPDRALVDLTKAADLDGYYAPYAAIAMSMIYFNRNDNRGALRVLNNYPVLYDPNRTSKSMVAVAYNNRCYAYMKLGDLARALDDCTQSLKYGSIPDAFRKQQELVKRLAAPGRTL